jgi:type I pantothenate kinase
MSRRRKVSLKQPSDFSGAEGGKVPYIIGVAGSVAAGNRRYRGIMQTLLSRWPNTPKVELITTDGFLYPNARTQKSEGLLEEEGFRKATTAQNSYLFFPM